MTVRRNLARAVVLAWLAAAAPVAAGSHGDCGAAPIVTRQIECFLAAAEAAGDAAICEDATDGTVRFQCLGLFAERTGDPAPCARIDAWAGADQTQALQDSCVAGVAIRQGRPALCRDVATPAIRDSCYAMLVTEAGADPALCARIEREPLRRACLDSKAEQQ